MLIYVYNLLKIDPLLFFFFSRDGRWYEYKWNRVPRRHSTLTVSHWSLRSIGGRIGGGEKQADVISLGQLANGAERKPVAATGRRTAPFGWRFLPGLYTWNETGLFTAHSGIDTTPLRSARAHLSITLLVTLPPLLLLLLLHREERAAISGSHIRLAARPSSLRRSSTIFKYSGPLVERASSSTATELVGWWPVKKIDQPSNFDVERAGWKRPLKILFKPSRFKESNCSAVNVSGASDFRRGIHGSSWWIFSIFEWIVLRFFFFSFEEIQNDRWWTYCCDWSNV